MSLKILIIGGVAGGMSAATRARRMNEHASITVLEKSGYVSYANCGLPYFVAGRIPSEKTLLVSTPALLHQRFNLDIRVNHEAIVLDRIAKTVRTIAHSSGKAFYLSYDKLILAPGSVPIIPALDNARAGNVFFMRNMEDTLGLNRWIKDHQSKSVAIVGAGYIGLEMAESLRQRGLAVTLIEKAPHVLPLMDGEMVRPVEAEIHRNGVKLITGCGIKSLNAENELVRSVTLEDGRTIDAEVVVLCIGVRPNIDLAKEAGLKLGPSGGIAVDEYQRTSDPDVYAVGDIVQSVHGVTGQAVRIPLAGPAIRQGRLAGEHAATGSARPAARVLGTTIVQVFGIAAGLTGLSEEAARELGFDADTAYALPSHHADFYPGAQALRIKLVYDQPTGRILGAQAVGAEGVDKRLDIIATATHFGGTVNDLANLDLAYAPQFGSARDPVHIIGTVAQNQRGGLMPAATVPAAAGRFILDVRTPAEFANGSLPGAVNIPVDELRGRLHELDQSMPIAVLCQVGLRGHVATRILLQNGFEDVVNIKGGYTLAV